MSAADRLDAIEARVNATTEGPWGVGYRHHVQASEFCECRPDYGPLVWVGETRINGGRKVPTHIHRAEASWHYSTTVYSEALPDVATVALSTDEYHEISPADAEFIAHARTDVPALVAALREVLDACDKYERVVREHRDAQHLIPAVPTSFLRAALKRALTEVTA